MSDKRAWAVTRTALVTTARASKTALLYVAKSARDAYFAVDPDVRQSVADLPLAATTMLGTKRSPIEPLPDDGHTPILCIHGLSGHRQNFLPLRALLWVHGRRRVYSLGYNHSAPLEESAAELVRAAEEVAERNELGSRKLVIVAHSMGGIVARLALFDARFKERVQQLVTLGTPHQGTLAARFLATPRTLDLRPDSALFNKLALQLPWSEQLPPLTAFWSPADIMMLPAACASVPGADNREISNVSHTGFLTRPRALACIREALEL